MPPDASGDLHQLVHVLIRPTRSKGSREGLAGAAFQDRVICYNQRHLEGGLCDDVSDVGARFTLGNKLCDFSARKLVEKNVTFRPLLADVPCTVQANQGS